MIRKILIGVGVLLTVLGIFTVQTLSSGGAFKTIEPHFGGTCQIVEGVTGAEDVTIDPATGFAYISAMDRRKLRTQGVHDGGIYLYLPGSFETPAKMISTYQGDFHPHGISLWKAPENSAVNDRLFVVSHPPILDAEGNRIGQSSQVDIFEINGIILNHIRSVRPDDPISLNDVAAIGPNSFYASIDQGSTTSLGRTLEVYGRLARSGVLYGNGEQSNKILGDLVYANGIQTSADGNTLYIAETTGKRLTAYTINRQTGALTFKSELDIDSGLDNIEIDENGNLWLASHPKTFDFLAHASDAAKRSASQVFLISDNNGMLTSEEIYLNDGNPISGSSVAAPIGNRFIVGSVLEPFILDCAR